MSQPLLLALAHLLVCLSACMSSHCASSYVLLKPLFALLLKTRSTQAGSLVLLLLFDNMLLSVNGT